MKVLFLTLACVAALGLAAPLAEAKGHHGRHGHRHHGHHHHLGHGRGDRHHHAGIALQCKINSATCHPYHN